MGAADVEVPLLEMLTDSVPPLLPSLAATSTGAVLPSHGMVPSGNVLPDEAAKGGTTGGTERTGGASDGTANPAAAAVL